MLSQSNILPELGLIAEDNITCENAWLCLRYSYLSWVRFIENRQYFKEITSLSFLVGEMIIICHNRLSLPCAPWPITLLSVGKKDFYILKVNPLYTGCRTKRKRIEVYWIRYGTQSVVLLTSYRLDT